MQTSISTTADLMALLAENGSDGIDLDTLEAAVKQLVVEGTNDKDMSSKPTKSRAKKMHDPNAPKKPKTAYMIFQWSEHGVPKIKTDNKGIAHTESVKRAAEIWRGMSDDDKHPFASEAEDLRSAWIKTKAEYVAANPEPTLVEKGKTRKAKGAGSKSTGGSKGQFVPGGAPTAPAGMTGPHQGYLSKVVKDTSGKRTPTFQSFEEAVATSAALGDKCGGITRTRLGYSLRIGPSISIDEWSHAKKELSWVKTTTASVDDDYDAETDTDEVEPESEKNVKTETEKNVEVETEAPKLLDPTPCPEDSGDENEEGDDYPEWDFEGKTYYYDEESNEVMNDDGEVIGERMKANKMHADFWIKFN
jgi:hypothetical protein